MSSKVKSFLKEFLPPFMLRLLRKRSRAWSGRYLSWTDAIQDCDGYNQAQILQTVDKAMEKIVSGEYPYERDSVLFDEVQYSWPVLTGLLWSCALQGRLDVLDFGGSLGTVYYQNRKFLSRLPLCWNVVEQSNYVTLGKNKYETEQLRFHANLEDCIKTSSINTLLISSSLQYIPDPESFLRDVVSKNIPFIILDRLSLINTDEHRLTKQTVPPQIYKASYPCWFFSEKRILAPILERYELVGKFDCFIKNEVYFEGRENASDYAFIFKLKA
jgi:putative methyltransferase (TIGR04325 family)